MTRIANTIDEAAGLIGDGRTVCCIGVFDGVHLGHRALIGSAIEEAERRNLSSLVFTFRNHPLSVLAPAYAPAMITEPDEKVRRLGELKPSIVTIIQFEPDFARTEPEDFVMDVLVKRLHVATIWCGMDFRFGRGGRGDIGLLQALQAESGIEARTIAPVQVDGQRVSSSRVRGLIEEGNVEEAARCLGRPHLIRGPVVSGFGRGRDLTFPTANVEPPPGIVLPADGIYAVRVNYDGQSFGGMLNLGPSPTFDVAERRFEVHLLDFRGDLLGATLTVHFIARLREIRRFDSAASLIAQIQDDERHTRRILES